MRPRRSAKRPGAQTPKCTLAVQYLTYNDLCIWAQIQKSSKSGTGLNAEIRPERTDEEIEKEAAADKKKYNKVIKRMATPKPDTKAGEEYADLLAKRRAGIVSAHVTFTMPQSFAGRGFPGLRT